MRKQTIAYLSALSLVVLVLAFYQTPLMAQARVATWDYVTTLTARVFRIDDIEVEKSVAEQLQELQAENIRLESELHDYERLRHQLATPPFDAYRAIPAAILARPIDTFHSQFIINKGILDGVVVRAPVVTSGSTLVGFITEVREHSSTVQSILHPSTQLTAETVPQSDEDKAARGLLVSSHYTSLALTTIPRDVTVTNGQAIVTAAKEELIPQGLLIGHVVRVLNPEHEAYQKADIELPYDIDELDAVHVITLP